MARPLLLFAAMRIVLPVHGDRVSPVLDFARRFLVMSASGDALSVEAEVVIDDANLARKARRIADLGAGVVICGAVSWPLEAILTSAGMRIIPNTCGPANRVARAFLAGDLTEGAFLMPGCPGRRRRGRHRRGRGRRNGR